MNVASPAARALVILVSAAWIAGCGGGASLGPTGAGVAGLRFGERLAPHTSLIVPAVRHHDRRASWVAPGTANLGRLLFVDDDVTDDVYLYSLPAMTLKGMLTGFSEPSGMCSDSRGRVWVTDATASRVRKYSRSGKLVGGLSLPGEYPVGCAVNQTTGDLAVASITDTSGGPGNVTIFQGGVAHGTPYVNPNQYEYFFIAYDPAGNLYVDGFDQSFNSMISELPVGSSPTMQTLAITGGTIYYPGGLTWYARGSYLLAGDQACGGTIGSCEYWVTVSGSAATITGSTPLTNTDGSACDVDQGTLSPLGNYFAGPCIAQGSVPSIAAVWPFSAGGAPTRYTSVTYPVGSAISNK